MCLLNGRLDLVRPFAVLFALAVTTLALQAQSSIQPDPPQREWTASWITHPTAPLREPIVLHFRRTSNLSSVPASYLVRVSADNRFILFVNGRRVGDGPARGDLTHWRYERFDLAPLLHAGRIFITATVWNFGIYAPIAQMSDRTAFLLESEATGADSISTPDRLARRGGERPAPARSHLRDSSGHIWPPVPARRSTPPATTGTGTPQHADRRIVGPGRLSHARQHLRWREQSPLRRSDRRQPMGPDSRHPAAHGVRPYERGRNRSHQSRPTSEASPKPPSPCRRTPNSHLLLDRKTLTTAYPQLTVSGGKGARIRLTYSEALYDKNTSKRRPRCSRRPHGLGPDGQLSARRRRASYLRASLVAHLALSRTRHHHRPDAPLTLESLTANFTGYPFEERATFKSGDPDLDKIWEISWRTARLDAHETYMDTPYYEQLQYIGDTRIQALISYAVAGDDRLARQALDAFNDSRIPEGLTRSRYPSSLPQTIPTFSLLWIGMLHDWWMYRPDPEPVRSALPGIRARSRLVREIRAA